MSAVQAVTGDEAGAGAVVPALADVVRRAQESLARAIRVGELRGDPLGSALEAISVSLDAQHRLHVANVEQLERARQPMDPAAVARLETAAATGADRRAALLARTHNLRTLLIYGGGFLGSLVVVAVVAFLWGRAAANVAVHETERRLAISFQDGPGAAAAWVNLMEQNDVLHSLSLCTGPRAFTDQAGRKACLLPMWVEPPRRAAPSVWQ